MLRAMGTCHRLHLAWPQRIIWSASASSTRSMRCSGMRTMLPVLSYGRRMGALLARRISLHRAATYPRVACGSPCGRKMGLGLPASLGSGCASACELRPLSASRWKAWRTRARPRTSTSSGLPPFGRPMRKCDAPPCKMRQRSSADASTRGGRHSQQVVPGLKLKVVAKEEKARARERRMSSLWRRRLSRVDLEAAWPCVIHVAALAFTN
mmetsp:Transcript_19306/g.25936  ORF Transcript_19306/g.25936 Transcript_19306/m.25936 type:complete len:210 (+) Transcript_19306:658-1287(+)